MSDSSNESLWPIMQEFLKKEGISNQHINSYNRFIEKGIQEIIRESNTIQITTETKKYTIKFGQVSIQNPRIVERDGTVRFLSPAEARLRNATYSAPIMVQVTTILEDNTTRTQQIHIGDIPILVRSKYCMLHNMSQKEIIQNKEDPLDLGGYFIINGSERVVMGYEDISQNRAMISCDKQNKQTTYKAAIYSFSAGYRGKIEITTEKEESAMAIKIPGSPVVIPLIILMKALGIESDREIIEMISPNSQIQDQMAPSFDHMEKVPENKESAKKYIGKRIAPGMPSDFQSKRVDAMMDWGVLPHIGKKPQDRKHKAQVLGDAACRILELKIGYCKPDDRDHYGNKIIRFAGELIADVIKTSFRNMIADIQYKLERIDEQNFGQPQNTPYITSVIRPGIITDKINNALATGNWGHGRVGISQTVDRTNYISALGQLRRILSPLEKSQPNFEARDLHGTHWGRICPAETPEGSNCGLVKNMAMMAVISHEVPEDKVIEAMYKSEMIHPDDATNEVLKKEGARIILNGRIAGYCQIGSQFTQNIRKMRQKAAIDSHVSIAYESLEKGIDRVYVHCNAGRVLRPLIRIRQGRTFGSAIIQDIQKGNITLDELVESGEIEIIDATEEENYYIAMNSSCIQNKHTHMEIFPPAILGAVAAVIPYPEHNQSPRNTYESAMAKQSLGFATPVMHATTYVKQHMMLYPQTPIVNSNMLDLLNANQRPAGQNCIVAVLPFDGYNIEDAIVLNKASVERGLGRTFFYRTYESELERYPHAQEKFEVITDPRIKGWKGSKAYRHLDEYGTAKIGAETSGGDVIIGKASPPRTIAEYAQIEKQNTEHMRDASVTVRPAEKGIVDTVFFTEDAKGKRTHKVKIRDMRIPEIGDKFAARHGQKGVVGILAKAEDLPYTDQGITPDLLINPHAFPSRMTIGMFMESICGKAAALRGKRFDGTAFVGEKIQDLKSTMSKHGFRYSGKERMYDGRTGKSFPVEIFIGIVHYQKLQHMVVDKIHARARGRIQRIIHQPTKGRAHGGGLRFGEMERDCIIAYGASMILKDRLLEEADRADVLVCARCGLLAYYDMTSRRNKCRVCGIYADINSVSVAYAFKLLLQEIHSLNIAARLKIKDAV